MSNTLVLIVVGNTTHVAILPWVDALVLISALRRCEANTNQVCKWPIMYGEHSEPEWEGQSWERAIRVRIWIELDEETEIRNGKTYHHGVKHFVVEDV